MTYFYVKKTALVEKKTLLKSETRIDRNFFRNKIFVLRVQILHISDYVELYHLLHSFLVSKPLCLSSSLALFLGIILFLVHHPINWDNRYLLAHVIASNFSVARRLSQREHFLNTDQTQCHLHYLPCIFRKHT
jgi:branched-subunit amino acid transport protein